MPVAPKMWNLALFLLEELESLALYSSFFFHSNELHTELVVTN